MATLSKILTEAGLFAIESALNEAHEPEEFLSLADAITADINATLSLPVVHESDVELEGTRGDLGVDKENAVEVYTFLGAMSKADAADGRLWTMMAFTTFRDYMERRWPLDGKDWRGRVKERWLMMSPKRQTLVRHGIARLWWLADMTYDRKCEGVLAKQSGDAFAYTRALFAREDRVQSIFERELGSNLRVVQLVLDHLEGSQATSQGSQVKALMKALRAESGYRSVGSVPEEDLKALILTADKYSG